MLGVGIPAEGGPSEKALAINISELIDGTDVRSDLYTHANNKASARRAGVQPLTGKIFAVHRGSEPDPARPGMRRGYGYSLKFILDVVRSEREGSPRSSARCATRRRPEVYFAFGVTRTIIRV